MECSICARTGTNARNMRAACNRSRGVREGYRQAGHCRFTPEHETTAPTPITVDQAMRGLRIITRMHVRFGS